VTGNKADGYTIHSVGNATRAEKKVAAKLKLKGLFDFAVFTKERLFLKNGTRVDWHIPDADGDSLKIGTNSTKENIVGLNSGVTINGDVAVGVLGDPDTIITAKSDATIVGTAYSLPEEQKFPIIQAPESLRTMPSSGAITQPATILTSGVYDRVSLANSETVVIDGRVALYIDGDITLDNSAQIIINDANPDASLTLFLDGDFISLNGGAINNLTKDPTRLMILGGPHCRSIDFRTAGDFFGAIYAPLANVRSHNSVQIHGAIISNSFIQDVAANLYYDSTLRGVGFDDIGVRFVIDRWYEE
jgi:hypothetical protein